MGEENYSSRRNMKYILTIQDEDGKELSSGLYDSIDDLIYLLKLERGYYIEMEDEK